MILLFFLVLFPAFLHPASVDPSETTIKKVRRVRYSLDGEDIQYVIAKLHEKFLDALGPNFYTFKRVMPWNLVEIVSGWPSSVYLLEPTNWCRLDIETMRAAVDSVVMKRADLAVQDTYSSDQLHSLLVNECKRLNLLKHNNRIIDWRRIAAYSGHLRLTTTHFAKWNTQDRKMIHRLVESMKFITDASKMLEYAPYNKHSIENLKKGWKKGSKHAENNDIQSRKKQKTESTIEENSENDVTENESIIEIGNQENEPEIQNNEAEVCQIEVHDDSFTPLLDTMPDGLLDVLADAIPKQPIILPSLNRSPSDLLLAQTMDVLSGSFEDSQLESILWNEL